jgi:hypothetical protein
MMPPLKETLDLRGKTISTRCVVVMDIETTITLDDVIVWGALSLYVSPLLTSLLRFCTML